jgi:microcystin-dependent protein
MSDPFVGEIRMFGGSFAPAGWAFCAGQLMAIAENETLFNLIGITYGGDGQQTFGLPDLQGRIPIHAGQGPGISQNYTIGEKAGSESVTVTPNQMPIHSHPVLASLNAADSTQASGNLTASTNQLAIYTEAGPTKNFSPNALSAVGGSQPHDNMMPYLVITFIISLFGIYPSQN